MTSPTEHRDDLSALLDGALDDAAAEALERELAEDDALREEFEGLADLRDDLSRLGDVKAPDGFLANVMARVDAGEGVDEPLFVAKDAYTEDDEGSNVVPLVRPEPREATDDEPRVAASATADNVVRFPWWLKGPALTAVAALLVVGVGYQLRDPGPAAPPAASEVVAFAPSDAPRPTGVVEEDDAVAAVDELAEAEDDEVDPSVTAEAERIRMQPSEDRMAVGGAGTTPVPSAPAPRPRRSGITEVKAKASPPAGVVVVAADEPEDQDAVAMADEPPEMPAAGLAPEARSGALGEDEEEAPARERSAMTAIASLRTDRPDAVAALRDAAARRGWALEFLTPAGGAVELSDLRPEQVVELAVPPGSEASAQILLDNLGTFHFTTTPEPTDGTSSRLRVTILFSP